MTKTYSLESKEQAVSQYVSAGFALFACRGKGEKPKAPIELGFQHTPYDPELTYEQLPVCYGVALRSDDLVLDYDPRRNVDGVDQLGALWALLKLLPADTYIVKTPSGGFHIYFKKPEDWKPKTDKEMADIGYGAIELKTAGRLVVAAGSRYWIEATEDTPGRWSNQYEMVRKTPLHVGQAPLALLEFLVSEKSATEANTGEGVESDAPGTQQRFVQFLMAARPAIEGQHGDATTLACAYKGRDYGLSEECNLKLMLAYYNARCVPEWPEASMARIVRHAYLYPQNSQGSLHPGADFANAPSSVVELLKAGAHAPQFQFDLHLDKQGKMVYEGTINNVVGFFLCDDVAGYPGQINPVKGLIRYNRFSDNIEFVKPAPWHQDDENKEFWDDTDTIMYKLFLSQKCNFHCGTALVREGVIAHSRGNQVHPIREWLKNLVWDGIPRLDLWLSTYCNSPDNRYTREIGKNTIIAACARVMEPGVQHDSMLVLEGPQGAGKSSLCRALSGDWYVETIIHPSNKDTIQNMQGGWFLEMAEMDALRTHEASEMKVFITTRKDKIRLPYNAVSSIIPRQNVLIGSINPEANSGYLKDITGNRRFWPVAVGDIDLMGIAKDRPQLFAEAFTRYKKGENFHITDKEILALAQGEQEKRVGSDVWEECVESWIAKNGNQHFTTSEVAYEALNITPDKMTRVLTTRLFRTLDKLGYQQDRLWIAELGKKVTVWHRLVDGV